MASLCVSFAFMPGLGRWAAISALDDQFCQLLFAFFLAVGVDISREAASVAGEFLPTALADQPVPGLRRWEPEGRWSRFPWRCVYILEGF